ncbi:hypothetical protein, partial [Hoyosella altamirensis]
GGGDSANIGFRWWHNFEDAVTWYPHGQNFVAPSGQLRFRYQARLSTFGGGSVSNVITQARYHRIHIMAQITEDPAV